MPSRRVCRRRRSARTQCAPLPLLLFHLDDASKAVQRVLGVFTLKQTCSSEQYAEFSRAASPPVGCGAHNCSQVQHSREAQAQRSTAPRAFGVVIRVFDINVLLLRLVVGVLEAVVCVSARVACVSGTAGAATSCARGALRVRAAPSMSSSPMVGRHATFRSAGAAGACSQAQQGFVGRTRALHEHNWRQAIQSSSAHVAECVTAAPSTSGGGAEKHSTHCHVSIVKQPFAGCCHCPRHAASRIVFERGEGVSRGIRSCISVVLGVGG